MTFSSDISTSVGVFEISRCYQLADEQLAGAATGDSDGRFLLWRSAQGWSAQKCFDEELGNVTNMFYEKLPVL